MSMLANSYSLILALFKDFQIVTVDGVVPDRFHAVQIHCHGLVLVVAVLDQHRNELVGIDVLGIVLGIVIAVAPKPIVAGVVMPFREDALLVGNRNKGPRFH